MWGALRQGAPRIMHCAAELAGFTVLRHNKNFDLIAGVTGQPLERLALA